MVGNFDADTDPVVAETLKGVPPAQPAAADDATRKVVDALSQQHGWGTPGSALSRITGKICTPHMSILLAMTKQLPRELMFRKSPTLQPHGLVTASGACLIASAERGPSQWRLDGLNYTFKAHIVSYFGAATLITDITPKMVENFTAVNTGGGGRSRTYDAADMSRVL